MSPANSYYLGSRKLVSQDDAALIQRARVPRSKFQNRWNHLTTFDAGILVPFLVDEILPGDHMRYNITAYLRMATALFPVFSNQRLDTFLFYTPSRILWTNWERFHGAQVDPADTIAFTVPQIISPLGGFAVGNIYDYMGLPVVGQIVAGNDITINALPFRAYARIYNDWFRDQNLINSVPINVGNGPDSEADYRLRRPAKSHDYFTSALPWPQKFTPLQTLFTGTAPVIGLGVIDGSAMSAAGGTYRETDNQLKVYPGSVVQNDASAKMGMRFDVNAVASAANPPMVYADLAQATGVTINALRQAWLVQDLLERDARGGTRYTEILRSHFGVVSPDFRVQRPEYIGGGQTPLNVTPVAQTATGGGGLGALGGVGAAVGTHGGSYAATEHGYIIGVMRVRTELAYQQGIHRMWSKITRYDFYYPALAGLGEQAILRKEIFATGQEITNDDIVFGYQERWHEYRTRYSEVTGLFRSTSAGNIDEWHLVQQFALAPTLSQAFIEDEPPMARVLAAGAAAAGAQYLADIQIERTATRPVPMFGTPATLARF